MTEPSQPLKAAEPPPTQHHEPGHRHGPGEACGCSGAVASGPDPAALISARGLWFRRAGRDLIAGIDLDVLPGEIVTVIGPNGAGKTTLVKLILGIREPDRGSVHRSANCSIGYVPQKFEVDRALPMTVARFLALGSATTDAAVRQTLDEVGAAATYASQLSTLSGGETQRVLIARALLRRPSLLVLDEPVRGVDYVGEADLYELISRLRDSRGLGVLLVSHDLHVVMAKSDRVICINQHVCCSGKPDIVSQHPEYVRLFGADAARTFAVYRHQHDHAHDLTGATLTADTPSRTDAATGPRGAKSSPAGDA
jgi:zinc transport system ATP-binding protein